MWEMWRWGEFGLGGGGVCDGFREGRVNAWREAGTEGVRGGTGGARREGDSTFVVNKLKI